MVGVPLLFPKSTQFVGCVNVVSIEAIVGVIVMLFQRIGRLIMRGTPKTSAKIFVGREVMISVMFGSVATEAEEVAEEETNAKPILTVARVVSA